MKLSRWLVPVMAALAAGRVWWADLATIFPDAFVVRGGAVLPVALVCGVAMLGYLAIRVRALNRAEQARARRERSERVLRMLSSPRFDDEVAAWARRLVGPHPAQPGSN